MTATDTTPYPVYAHPLLSWGSVILGAVAAIAIGVLLNLLVALFDASASLAALSRGGEAGDNALLVGVFGALANLLALFTGGFIAARAANQPDHHDGMLHGLGVWAVSFVVAFALLGSGATHAVGAAVQAAGTDVAPAQVGGAGAGPGAPDGASAPPVTTAQERAAQADADAEVRLEAHDLAKSAAETAFFGFAAMLVGLVAALMGGVAGARHPEHFRVRPRRAHVIV